MATPTDRPRPGGRRRRRGGRLPVAALAVLIPMTADASDVDIFPMFPVDLPEIVTGTCFYEDELYAVGKDNTLMRYDLATGELLGSFGPLIPTVPVGHLHGMTAGADGTFWVGEIHTRQLYQMRFSDYSVVSVLDAPPGSPTFGLTFRDGILWVGHHSDGPTTPIRAVDPQTGDTLWLFDPGITDVHGLAWVGDYLWVLDNITDLLHQVDPFGEIGRSFALPDRFWTSLVYDGTDLWISDGFTPADAFSRVVPVSPLCPPPGAVADVLFTDRDTLVWSEPSVLGGTFVVYDTLRSGDASDFTLSADCVEWDDGADTTAAAEEIPAPGSVFHYVVRAENACPIGEGPLGPDSNGVEREGRGCP